MINKSFSRTEIKILIYNKMKSGMSYEDAIKEVEQAVEQVKQNKKKHFFVEDNIIVREDLKKNGKEIID